MIILVTYFFLLSYLKIAMQQLSEVFEHKVASTSFFIYLFF